MCYFSLDEKVDSNIIFRRIDNPGTQRILGCFMHIVDFQFSEDILSVGGDGMDAGETFGSYLFGRFSQSDGL